MIVEISILDPEILPFEGSWPATGDVTARLSNSEIDVTKQRIILSFHYCRNRAAAATAVVVGNFGCEIGGAEGAGPPPGWAPRWAGL
jgi:hypothetical protein